MEFLSNFYPIVLCINLFSKLIEIGEKLLKSPLSFLAVRKKGWKSKFLEQNTYFFVNVTRFARKNFWAYSNHVGTPWTLVFSCLLTKISCLFTYVIWGAYSGVGQLPSISFPRLSFSLWIGGRGDLILCRIMLLGRTDKIRGLSLWQVPVELRPVRLFQSRAQPKIRQLDMSPRV